MPVIIAPLFLDFGHRASCIINECVYITALVRILRNANAARDEQFLITIQFDD